MTWKGSGFGNFAAEDNFGKEKMWKMKKGSTSYGV
jgi:hypothetical protein